MRDVLHAINVHERGTVLFSKVVPSKLIGLELSKQQSTKLVALIRTVLVIEGITKQGTVAT